MSEFYVKLRARVSVFSLILVSAENKEEAKKEALSKVANADWEVASGDEPEADECSVAWIDAK